MKEEETLKSLKSGEQIVNLFLTQNGYLSIRGLGSLYRLSRVRMHLKLRSESLRMTNVEENKNIPLPELSVRRSLCLKEACLLRA